MDADLQDPPEAVASCSEPRWRHGVVFAGRRGTTSRVAALRRRAPSRTPCASCLARPATRGCSSSRDGPLWSACWPWDGDDHSSCNAGGGRVAGAVDPGASHAAPVWGFVVFCSRRVRSASLALAAAALHRVTPACGTSRAARLARLWPPISARASRTRHETSGRDRSSGS